MQVKERIYFAAAGGRIKVGTTERVQARVASIGAYLPDPISLLGSIAGGLPFERAIQAYLNPWHLKGEWFRDCTEVRLIVERLLSLGPDAIDYDGPMFSHERPQKVRSDVSRPADPKALGRLLLLMWPDAAVAELCAFTGCNKETASRWLAGDERPPRLIRYALAAVFSDYLIMERHPSFLESGEDGPAAYTPCEESA